MDHPLPPGPKAAGIDAVLRTQATCLEVFILDRCSETNDDVAAELNGTVGIPALKASRESIRRWIDHYVEAESKMAAK